MLHGQLNPFYFGQFLPHIVEEADPIQVPEVSSTTVGDPEVILIETEEEFSRVAAQADRIKQLRLHLQRQQQQQQQQKLQQQIQEFSFNCSNVTYVDYGADQPKIDANCRQSFQSSQHEQQQQVLQHQHQQQQQFVVQQSKPFDLLATVEHGGVNCDDDDSNTGKKEKKEEVEVVELINNADNLESSSRFLHRTFCKF